MTLLLCRRLCCFLWLALGGVLLLLSACRSVPEKPEITLAGVDLVAVGVAEQHFIVRLTVRNPNDCELSVDAMHFDLELNERLLARGKARAPVTLPRRGETVLAIDSVSRFADVLSASRAMGKKSVTPLRYRLRGEIEIGGWGRWPFERLGEWSPALFERARKGVSRDDRPL